MKKYINGYGFAMKGCSLNKLNKIKMKNKNNNKKVNKTQAVELIQSTKGQFFTVTFVKANGNTRTINGNVKKNAVSALGLITIYSPSDKGYRTVNSQTIKSVSFNKTTYTVK